MNGGPDNTARQTRNSPAPLPAGTPAPDFSLASGPDTELRLSDHRGHPYNAYRAGDGFSQRALFVLDRDGIIRWSYLSPVDANPAAEGLLSALEALPSPASHIGAPS